MSVLPDHMIKRDIGITPFSENEKREGKISYGLSSYGYDARLGYKFKIIKPYPVSTIDPKNFDDSIVDLVELKEGDVFELPPHSFVLGETVEHFSIPRDILCIVTGKSTYARCGVYINVTPGEPEWQGVWTVEISNTTPKTARIYPGEGIMQCIFLRTDGYTQAMAKTITEILSERVLDRPEMDAQFNKLMEDGTCRVSYADKKGKYDKQTGLTLPKVD